MRKVLIALFAVMFLVACGEENAEQEVEQVEGNEEINKMTEKVIKEVNEVIADDEYVKATLIDVIYKEDVDRGKRYNINIEVVNKADETISVTTGEQSIDDTMADELFYYVEDISTGKSADTTIVIEDLSGDDNLPSIEKNIEFSFDTDIDSEIVSRHEVKITIE